MTTTILAVLTALLAAATAISFLRIAHGFVRVFSFPRIQIIILAAIVLVAVLVFVEPGWLDSLMVASLIAVIVAQAATILQFTPVRRPETAIYEGDPDGENTLSLVSFNIKESNRNYEGAMESARSLDPDLMLFMETDRPWVEALQPLGKTHPNVVSHPLDNAYGMILFSRLEIADSRVEYLIMDEIPSIHATIVLRDGQRFKLICVHPEPPVPHVDSLGRDAELITVARMVTEEPLPCLVTGDLNDVAWSNTTRMFQRLSRLLDPRVGRGFYNTFDARFFFMRWPLDHLFHDRRFQLIAMRRLDPAGSDHFPMYFKLALTRHEGSEVEMPARADAQDREEAAEIVEEGRRLDRDPIGTDWEN